MPWSTALTPSRSEKGLESPKLSHLVEVQCQLYCTCKGEIAKPRISAIAGVQWAKAGRKVFPGGHQTRPAARCTALHARAGAAAPYLRLTHEAEPHAEPEPHLSSLRLRLRARRLERRRGGTHFSDSTHLVGVGPPRASYTATPGGH